MRLAAEAVERAKTNASSSVLSTVPKNQSAALMVSDPIDAGDLRFLPINTICLLSVRLPRHPVTVESKDRFRRDVPAAVVFGSGIFYTSSSLDDENEKRADTTRNDGSRRRMAPAAAAASRQYLASQNEQKQCRCASSRGHTVHRTCRGEGNLQRRRRRAVEAQRQATDETGRRSDARGAMLSR